jgi:uncharacterized membrane protein
MSVLVVVIFDDERQTSGCVQSLRALHDQGRISLYAVATIVRGGGSVAPRMPVGREEAVAGPAVGAAMGALLSLLEGPLHAAARAVPHVLIGAMREIDEVGLDPAFLEQVSRDLPVGGAAVLSQLDELRPFLIDTLGPQHGGRVLRQRLAAVFAERRLVTEITALRQDLARVRARNRADEPDSAAAAASRIKGIELASAVRRARKLAASLRREAAAKAQVMQRQAERLGDGPSQAVLRRAAIVQARLERRAKLLERVSTIAADGADAQAPYQSERSADARDS